MFVHLFMNSCVHIYFWRECATLYLSAVLTSFNYSALDEGKRNIRGERRGGEKNAKLKFSPSQLHTETIRRTTFGSDAFKIDRFLTLMYLF